MNMNMNINIGWILTLLVLFNVISISISAVDKLAGQSDSYIYGLCNVNKYSSGSEYERNLKRVLQSLVDGAAPSGGWQHIHMAESMGLCNAGPTSLTMTAKAVQLQRHRRLFKAAPTP